MFRRSVLTVVKAGDELFTRRYNRSGRTEHAVSQVAANIPRAWSPPTRGRRSGRRAPGTLRCARLRAWRGRHKPAWLSASTRHAQCCLRPRVRALGRGLRPRAPAALHPWRGGARPRGVRAARRDSRKSNADFGMSSRRREVSPGAGRERGGVAVRLGVCRNTSRSEVPPDSYTPTLRLRHRRSSSRHIRLPSPDPVHPQRDTRSRPPRPSSMSVVTAL